MDYSPWLLKNLIHRNQLKKFTQVGIDVKCMHTDFGGHGLSGFGDKISLWSIKVEKFNLSESAQKIHASRDRYQVHAHQFWLGVVSPVSEILLPFKNGQISILGHGLQSMVIEKFNRLESAQKIHASRG